MESQAIQVNGTCRRGRLRKIQEMMKADLRMLNLVMGDDNELQRVLEWYAGKNTLNLCKHGKMNIQWWWYTQTYTDILTHSHTFKILNSQTYMYMKENRTYIMLGK